MAVTNANLFVVDQQPSNINALIGNDFIFRIHRAPHVNYFIQSCSIPGVTVPAIQMPTPHAVIPIEANRPIYDNLSISFKVDEYLTNYLQIYNWIRALGKPVGPEYRTRFGPFADKPDSILDSNYLSQYSDCSLFVNTSLKNPLIEFVFRDAFPVAISQIPLYTTNPDATEVVCTVFFAYTYFDVIRSDGTDTTAI